jgi:hypothetical protein
MTGLDSSHKNMRCHLGRRKPVIAQCPKRIE